ncbi:MAG: SDR family oxidoreductase [Candidatus Protochlamydia sp.]|nr:SDR family oxidoreductase [Candidatus Protochlamydia sp.]
MKILLTGANGYIGTRLLPLLLEQGHEVYALVRSGKRMVIPPKFEELVHVIQADLLDPNSLEQIPDDIEAAYYLVHSMSLSVEKFTSLEAESAVNFRDRLSRTAAVQIIYLSGIVNDEQLSNHLASRKNVEAILRQGKVPVTTLMAGIIIGAGSASFEIIRDLVEKLPIMVAPKWTKNMTQPIAIRDVLEYLKLVLGHPACIGRQFEIGGPDVISYRNLLHEFARVRSLKRWIITVPVLTPKLSSYWLYFITSASFPLARSLVESLKNNAICKENTIHQIFPMELLNFESAVRRSFSCIEEDNVPSSSWKDAIGNSFLNPDLSTYVKVPNFGTLCDQQEVFFTQSPDQIKERIWSLGGENGWAYMNWAWKLRGFADNLLKGTGLRRGRTHPHRLKEGDALDFWRVLVADEKNKRLMLYAEMKLPGEAWLEFKIVDHTLYQTATFRPHGLLGRIYWYALFPFHYLIFRGMARALVKPNE